MKRTNISAGQFFIAMFVSGSVVTLALNSRYTGGENLLESLVSCVAAMALGVLIALPIGLALGESGEGGVPELAMKRLGPVGWVVPLCYVGYFVLAGSSTLALFLIFLMDTVNPGFSAWLVGVALVGVALFGALRGLETVGRSATCVFAAVVLGCGLVFGLVAWRFDPENLEPLFYQGLGQTVHSVGLFLARASIFADMAVLLPQVRGKRARGFAGWMAGTVLFVGITILLTAGCLGRYAYTQNFPVYVLASLTQVRSLQRLDAVFTGVWMMGLVVKLAWDLYACRVCFWALWRGNKARSRWALWATAGAVLALAMLGAGLRPVQRVLMNTWLLALCTGAVGAVPPLLVWLAGCFQRKKGGG